MKDTDKAQEQLSQELAALHRRVAELEALRDSEAQYRATLDAMSDMLHVVDDELRIVFANDALRRRNGELGLATDVVGKTIDEVYPFLPQGIRGEYAEVFKSGRLLVTEECTRVGDEEIFTETRKIPVCEGGKVTQIITVMRDITEHKRAEETLRLLEAGVRCATDAIVITRATSTHPPEIVYVNPAFTQMTGYMAEELAGKTVQVLKGPKTDLSVARRMAATAAQGKVFQAEWILYRKDGSEFDMEMRTAPIRDAAGKITHTVSVLRDVTERKQAEEEIRRQAETLSALHETALDLATQRALTDLLSAIVIRATGLLNAREGSFFAYRPAIDDLERAFDYNVDPPPDPRWTVLRRGEGVAGRVLESGRPLAVDDYNRWEGRLKDYDKDFAILGVPICWGDRPLGVLTVADGAPRSFSPADVALLERFAPLAAAALENNHLLHDLQQQMDKLKEAQAQLIQAAKLAAVGELAAGVAHELNNPLTSIMGFAELLLHDTPADAPARHDLEVIAKQAARARDIVRNLLGFARQTKPQRVPASVNQVFQQTMDLVRQLIEKSRIDIVEEYASDIGLLTLDSGQMKQVFLNLITNAAHAMPLGGTMRVRTACESGEVAISISDTGEGIPPEIQEHIFEPFFTTKPVGQGTGLGLSVSLGIIQAHAGRITVESRAGQGSTFTVWLPANKDVALSGD
jgi:PAS domain S-box-containing protein